MSKLKLDLRFIGILHEFDVIEDFIKIVEKNIKIEIKKKEKESSSIIKMHCLKINQFEYQLLEKEKTDFIEHLLPKYLRNPLMVSIWAVIETSLLKIADFIKTKNPGNISNFKDKKGKNFLNKINNYFKDDLKFEILTDSKIYNELFKIMKIRHLIAHCNGNFKNIKTDKDKKWFLGIIKNESGISLYNDEIIISPIFISNCFYVARSEISSIINRVKQKYEGV